jgi:hypothetical protein
MIVWSKLLELLNSGLIFGRKPASGSAAGFSMIVSRFSC